MALYRTMRDGLPVGTWMVQRRIMGIRIRQATGCTEREEAEQVEQTLLKLGRHGRRDLVLAFRDRQITGPELVSSVEGYGVTFQLTVTSAVRLRRAMYTWLRESKLALKTRKDYRWSLGVLVGKLPPIDREPTEAEQRKLAQGSTLEQLPDLLARYARQRTTKPVMFVQVKAAAQSFVRDTVPKGQHSPLWQALAAIQGPKRKRRDVQGGLTPDRAREVAEALGGMLGRMWWWLCCTGMGPREYWKYPNEPLTGRWEAYPDRVIVHGTKRDDRDRIVFRIADAIRPALGNKAFAKKLKAVGAELGIRKLTPYVARRTFSHWLKLAKIDDSRCDAYMGHSPKSDREKYREHDVLPYLAEDRKAFRAVVGDDPQFVRVVA